MSNVTRCPKCCTVVRSEAAHCPMCGADIPAQTQFGLDGMPAQSPCTGPVPPPPTAPRPRGNRTATVLTIGCLGFALILGAAVFHIVNKIIRNPETIVNKVVDQGARDAAQKFFKTLDAGDFEAAWNMGDNTFHSAITLREFSAYMLALHTRYGQRIKPVIKSYRRNTQTRNGKTTTTHTLTFETEFKKGASGETLTLMEQDGAFTVHAYKGPTVALAQRTPHSPGGRMPRADTQRGPEDPSDSADVEAAANRFMDALDSGDYDAAWDMTADEFRSAFGRDAFNKLMKDIKAAHGKRGAHRSIGFNTTSVFSNGQAAVTYSITYRTTFEKGDAVEEVVLSDTGQGLAVSYYTILSDAVTPPDVERPAPFHHGEREHPQMNPEIPEGRGLEI